MAMGLTYKCSHCGFSILAWDEGNPYFLSDTGEPQFFFHPGREEQLQEYIQQSAGRFLTGDALQKFRKKRTGNMSDMLCLDCGEKFMLDLKKRKAKCPSIKCKSTNIADICELNEKTCPKCNQGVFKEDPRGRMIS